MAGILGVYDPGMAREQLEPLLSRMQEVITHESWCEGHTFVQPPLAAGRVSLGILNPQPQPASNEDGSVLVWMDGEIYDFQRRELTHQLETTGCPLKGDGDADLLAHLHEESRSGVWRACPPAAETADANRPSCGTGCL